MPIIKSLNHSPFFSLTKEARLVWDMLGGKEAPQISDSAKTEIDKVKGNDPVKVLSDMDAQVDAQIVKLEGLTGQRALAARLRAQIEERQKQLKTEHQAELDSLRDGTADAKTKLATDLTTHAVDLLTRVHDRVDKVEPAGKVMEKLIIEKPGLGGGAKEALEEFVMTVGADRLKAVLAITDPAKAKAALGELTDEFINYSINLMPGLSEAKPEEVALLDTLKVGEQSFSAFFGKDLATALSMRLDIKPKEATAAEGVLFMIGAKPIATIDDLAGELPGGKEGKEGKAILAAKDASGDGEPKKQIEALTQMPNLNPASLKAMLTMQEQMKKAAKDAAEKEPGAMDSLVAIIQLIAAIQKALKADPPDMETLNDFLNDFNNEKDPSKLAGKPVEASKEYARILKERMNPKDTNHSSLDTLFTAWTDPRGDTADALFSPTSANDKPVRYRGERAAVIQNYVKGELGYAGVVISPESDGGRKLAVTISGNNKVDVMVSKANNEGAMNAKIGEWKAETITNLDGLSKYIKKAGDNGAKYDTLMKTDVGGLNAQAELTKDPNNKILLARRLVDTGRSGESITITVAKDAATPANSIVTIKVADTEIKETNPSADAAFKAAVGKIVEKTPAGGG